MRHESKNPIIARRLKEAREIANISVKNAARQLGFKTQSALCKIEKGLIKPSINLILQASQLYDVSADFIFGLNDDWEKSLYCRQQRDCNSWIINAINKNNDGVLQTLNIIKNKLYNLVEISEFLALKSQETNDAFLRFVELNKDDFLDLKGGAKLEKLITEIYNAAKFFINEKQKFSTVISRNSKIHNLCEFNEQLPLLEKIAQYKQFLEDERCSQFKLSKC